MSTAAQPSLAASGSASTPARQAQPHPHTHPHPHLTVAPAPSLSLSSSSSSSISPAPSRPFLSSANNPSLHSLSSTNSAVSPSVPSPATSSLLTNMGSNSSPNAASLAAPLTLDALLALHANAADPMGAALDQALSERNLLSAQNQQLWKLIEKQRTGYGQILKELERVRAEREVFKARLQAVGQSVELGSSKKEKAKTSEPQRVGMVRHMSDENASGRESPIGSQRIMVRQMSADNGVNVYDRARSPESLPRERQMSLDTRPSHTQNGLLAGPGQRERHISEGSRPGASPSATSPSSSLDSLSEESEKRWPTHKSPPPLVIPGPHRSESLHPSAPAPHVQISTSNSASPTPVDSTASHTPLLNVLPLHIAKNGSTPNSSPITGNTLLQFPAPPTTQPHPSATNGLGPSPGHASGQSLTPPQAAGVRDSRISLPDEAKRYIATMVDSPQTTPNAAQAQTSFSDLQQSATRAQSPPQAYHQPNGQGSRALHKPSTLGQSPVTNDSDEEDEEEDMEDAYGGQATPVDSREGAFLDMDDDDGTVESSGAHQEQSSQSTHQSVTDPYKPSNSSRQSAMPFSQYHPSPADVPGSSQQTQSSVQAPPTASTTSLSTTTTLVSARAPPPQAPPPPQPSMSSKQVDPTYRALPLLPTDLPTTTIQVVQATIKPNERGKEVLTFIIHVQPGGGKEGWKVEKLLSDVLGLDHRVRSTVGKTAGKKIVGLPEGKLWRDHAPAKADQRKAALEAFLRSLIDLPIKNKDEIVAFFTSDILRATAKPVTQAGYKEGYLTKRGRNFGGWKSRYFVVQGPSLEYYESRGGQHLGTISITGAQIGRQQRSGDRRESEDDSEYRHAFLIIESRKLPNGSHPRHVLCAESDYERDVWVEVLVRYVMGTYNEDAQAPSQPPSHPSGSAQGAGQGQAPIAPAVQNSQPTGALASSSPLAAGDPRGRSGSTTSTDEMLLAAPYRSNKFANPAARGMSKDEIVTGNAIPISHLPPDASNAKLMQAAPYPASLTATSPPVSQQPLDVSPTDNPAYADGQLARRILEGHHQPHSSEASTLASTESSSLDDGSTAPRSNSALGTHSDAREVNQGRESPEARRGWRKSQHPTAQPQPQPTPHASTDRPVTPENAPRADGKKVSGPFGGARLAAGFKFGNNNNNKDAAPPPQAQDTTPAPSDRREKAKSRMFWGFGKQNAPAADKPQTAMFCGRPVFGVPLEEALEVVQLGGLPAIAFRCIQYLEAKKADQEEGIYRLSGSSAVIKALRDRFNQEGDVDLIASDEFWDPHAIAGLLKTFFRELPTSILTRDRHLMFLAVMDFVDTQERVRELARLVAELPIANYSLLRALAAHLILIVQNASVNKMTMRNVGIVFSPTLGVPAGVFSLMLGEFDRVFNVGGGDAEDEAGEEEAADEEEMGEEVGREEQSSPNGRPYSSRRNSRQYVDAAADKLLGLSGRHLAAPEDSEESGEDVIIEEESDGEDTTDHESATSPTDSTLATPTVGGQGSQNHLLAPPGANGSRMKQTAMSRGLNIAVHNGNGAGGSPTDARSKRQSRMFVGLPTSPRPTHTQHPPPSPNHSNGHGSSNGSSSPMDTPR